MALISLQDVVVAFGGPRVFDELSLQLEPNERVALLGRNGTGKTTLMKVIAGLSDVDGGKVIRQQGLEVRHLPQEVPMDLTGSVFDIVASGLGSRGTLLADYHHVSHQMMTDHSPELMRKLDRLQEELDRTGGWDINNQVESAISQMGLDIDAEFARLSGGQKRRVLLARALAIKPDILLLDEPTNHLDIASIDWLEGFLKNFPGTLLFVTHDRVFMRHMATRIIELDRGKIFSASCDYDTFLQRKQMMLEAESAQRTEFDKKLAQEEVWIRQGVKARRTRNEGRVKALERMREEKRNQRQQIGRANMQAQEAEKSGHLVAKIANLGYSYGDQPLIKNFSASIMRGDKIGIIGPNGSGKTTLIKLLLGKMEPQMGKVRLGTNLEIAYYDQLREELDEEKTVIENMSQGAGDMITINGKPRHVIGYMQDFLFSPERARTPVKVLSGGERNRLFLARLFTKPSNVLVMDEPTNDLDIETLELLEELLLEYSGTLLLVSHDRAFLNNVVTSTFVLEGGGVVNEYVGGYDDWLAQRPQTDVVEKDQPKKEKPVEVKPKNPSRKLSYKEERELAALPESIEYMESEIAKIHELMADSNFYKDDPVKVSSTSERLSSLETDLAKAYERWEALEKIRKDL